MKPPQDPQQQRLNAAERANLVAYLDGELDEEQANYLASKITLSVSARREVEDLEKAWELLDFLPKPRAPEDFTARTLTQANQLGDRGEWVAGVLGRSARTAILIAVCAVSTLAAVGVGYAATRWLIPDRSARLARDLPIAEHLDEYRDVESFEFLELLEKSEYSKNPF